MTAASKRLLSLPKIINEFIHLPFGLKNVGATFQRLMNRILKGLLGKCCFVYIDDIVVYSKDVQQHIKDLKAVFCEMEAGGLTLYLKKCNLCKKSLSFLGHVISEEGIKTEGTKVESVKNFPTPRSLKKFSASLALLDGIIGSFHVFQSSLFLYMLSSERIRRGIGLMSAKMPLRN